MRCLVIGASGYVGRACVRLLVERGHLVEGLARSNAAAASITGAGAVPLRGSAEDIGRVAADLDRFDAVIFAPQLDRTTERDAVTVLLEALRGTNKCLIMTSGTAVLSRRNYGEWAEDSYAEDEGPAGFEANERVRTETLVRSYAGQGVRAMVVRPPMIWGHGRCPPLAALHSSARTGAVCYPGRGLNVCSSIHVDDLADIFVLALGNGRPGALYHAVSGETNWRSIAEHIAKLRQMPTRSVSYQEAKTLFGPFLAPVVFATNMRTRCPRTRGELGWVPHPERLDLFAELAHPAFMALGEGASDDAGFTLASALRVGREEG